MARGIPQYLDYWRQLCSTVSGSIRFPRQQSARGAPRRLGSLSGYPDGKQQ